MWMSLCTHVIPSLPEDPRPYLALALAYSHLALAQADRITRPYRHTFRVRRAPQHSGSLPLDSCQSRSPLYRHSTSATNALPAAACLSSSLRHSSGLKRPTAAARPFTRTSELAGELRNSPFKGIYKGASTVSGCPRERVRLVELVTPSLGPGPGPRGERV